MAKAPLMYLHGDSDVMAIDFVILKSNLAKYSFKNRTYNLVFGALRLQKTKL